MSILTGCICSECKKWHSHIVKLGNRFICVNCNRKLEGGKKK